MHVPPDSLLQRYIIYSHPLANPVYMPECMQESIPRLHQLEYKVYMASVYMAKVRAVI